jgi:Beta-propeller repeat
MEGPADVEKVSEGSEMVSRFDGARSPEIRWPPPAAAAGCLLAIAILLSPGARSPDAPPAEGGLGASIAKAPLAFEPNADRTDESVDFLARSVAGGNLYLGSSEAVLALPEGKRGSRALHLSFPGADPEVDVRGLEELPGRANSFVGDDPSRWRSGIPTYGRVRYDGIYPGVDLDFYGDQRDLEYDLRLAPHADPSRIAVEMDGADALRLTPNGDLLIEVGKRTVRQKAPVAYQAIGGGRRRVAAAYELHGSTLRFQLGDYDRSRPLVIDPLVLAYSTYLGGGGFDAGAAIAVDAAGAAYVTGVTDSTDFPTQDAYQDDQTGGDAFVAKFDPDSGGGVTLAYSTYLGGGGFDLGNAIAVDAAGAAYVTGATDSTDFPTQDTFQTDQPGTDAFVTKLDPDSGGAVTLAYSTYLGGGNLDRGGGIAVDGTGAAYLIGQTVSVNFPTQDELQTDRGGDDAFVTKVNPDAGGLVTLAYSTYLGGDSFDANAHVGIAVDSAGAAYVTGDTASTNFPSPDAFQAYQGTGDAFVAKLNPDSGGLVTLAYGSYLGGGGEDLGTAIAIDAAGAAYVTGITTSTDFPTQDAFQPDQPSGDAFVTKLDPDSGGAVTLAYSTYLGGGASEGEGTAIAVDSAGAAYVSGITISPDFPTKEAFQADQPGADAFVAKLDPDSGGAATLAYSTYLGGGARDAVRGPGIALDPTGSPYVIGDTDSSDFPTQDALQADQGGTDAFVARLELPAPPPPEGGVGDTDPPETVIVKGPKKKTKKRKAKFEFASDEPGSTFQCQLDRREFEACDPSETFRVKRKKHTLQVQAVDPAGNVDLTPASHSWKVKRTPK